MSRDRSHALRLATLFQPGALWDDQDGDGLAEVVRAMLVLGVGAGAPEQRAAVNLAARLGFESLALQLPLAAWEPPAVDSGRIPIFIGRSSTLSPDCPAPLANLLATLDPGEGVVALLVEPSPALLVGGADDRGLAAAAHALAAAGLAEGLPVAGLPAGVEALRFVAADRRPGHREASEQSVPPSLRSLGDLFGPEGLAVDSDGNLLPDRPRTHLALPDDLSPDEAIAAIHLGARLGLETLGLALPLCLDRGTTKSLPAGEVQIRIEPLSPTPTATTIGSIRLLTEGDGQLIQVAGDAQGRATALETLAGLDAWTVEERPSLAAVEHALGRLCALADPGTALCAALPALDHLPSAPAGSGDPLDLRLRVPASWPIDHQATGECLRRRLEHVVAGRAGEVAVETTHPAVLIDEIEQLPWEVDEAWRLLRSSLWPALAALPGGKDWFLDLRISESESRRRAIQRAIVEEIRASGRAVDDTQVRILPAYHQGRAWLLEEVLPLLRALPVATLLVRVKRFVPDTPSLELPIRWLQDLFPVDELLAAPLGLPTSAICFEIVEDLDSTYVVDAYDAEERTLLQQTFEVVYTARPYLPGFAHWGAVHPATGCVRLVAGSDVLVDLPLPTDPERVWDYLQGSLLPRLAAAIRDACGGELRRERQPFFGELAVDVWLSEEDVSLGVREERSSPLECLHEDLYFVLLDYCSALISAASDETPYLPPWIAPADPNRSPREARRWTAPGRIVPRIHRHDGAAGRVQIVLTGVEQRPVLFWRRGRNEGYAHHRGTETQRGDGDRGRQVPLSSMDTVMGSVNTSGVLPLLPASIAAVRIVGMEVSTAEAPRMVLALDGTEEACAQARGILAGWGELRAAGAGIEIGVLASWAFRLEGAPDEELPIPAGIDAIVSSDPNSSEMAASVKEENEPAVPWDRVLGGEDVAQMVRRIGRLPGIHTFQAGRSALGRPVWAMEATVPRAEGWWSRAKLSGWKCSLLLNGRHHGNEPASTSTLLRLAELLATDEEWRCYLERVNVILIPSENPDGMDLHEALQAEHPAWMHHAARYNAAGMEYAAAYASPTTPHTEALVLPLLWRRWVPDIFCDNHGFPAHAWEQPFSGQGNPWFRAFWIPQGLIYAYLPELPSARFPHHAGATASIAARLVDALADDPSLADWNARHAERYRTFLHDRMPEEFPAAYERDVLIHRSVYEPEGDTTVHAGFPGVYPGMTTASLVTEVADETAQGEYLALCAHAHLVIDRALLQYLFDANGPGMVHREQRSLSDGRVLLRATRTRPARVIPAP